MGSTTRRIDFFRINAHTNGEVANYNEMFSSLGSLSEDDRTIEVGHFTYAINTCVQQEHTGWYFLVVYRGTREPLVVYDKRTHQTRTEELGDDEFVGHKTHVIVDLSSRFVAIEYNHRGTKHTDLAHLLETILHANTLMRNVEISFSPIVSEQFIDEIHAFERIREASISVTRPNVDWLADNKDSLSDLAGRSNGHRANVSVNAGRGEDLERNDGLLQIAKTWIRKRVPSLLKVSIKGKKFGDTAESSVSTDDMSLHRKVTVETDDVGQASTPDVEAQMTDIVREQQEADMGHDE